MRNTTSPQLFRAMEGKTYQLGRMTMAFKRRTARMKARTACLI
jgi:hypothetical protein